MDLQAIAGGAFWSLLGFLALAIVVIVLLSKTVRYIPNNRVGIVEKLISGRGSVKSGLIALAGEAGFQPEVLRGGWHFFVPFMYRIHKVFLVTIAQAMAIEEQVRAYGGPQFQLVQQVMNRFAEAIQASQVDVVPKINMTGQAGGGNLIESLLGVLLSDRVGELVGVAPSTPRDPSAQALRDQMMARITRPNPDPK
jgi:uncharacterized membrane protein YqiK